jgi:phenylpropionate dioxygenase-like ring-hydroxylating dioxygenase large terminal subunit
VGEGTQLKFTCPYHAWSYDTKGQLVAAPMMEQAKNFEPRNCKLPEIRSEIWQGFIVANLAEDADAFSPQVEGLTQHFDQYQLDDHVIQRTLEFDSNWNWKVLVENFMEAYHHIGTHSATLQPGLPARNSRVPDKDGPWSILKMPPKTLAGSETNHGSLMPVPGLKEEDHGTL